MKIQLAFPIMILTLAVVACGKKDDAAVVTNGVVAAPQPFPVPYPYPYPNPTPVDINTFCQSYGGQVVGSVCRLTRNYTNNAWLSFAIGDLTPQIEPIVSGDRVIVSVSNNPKVYVGGYYYGAGSMSFMANNSGYLKFSKWSFSTFSVQSIQIQRCYNSSAQVVSCP